MAEDMLMQQLPTMKQLRSFGLILACGFATIGLWPAWHHHPPRPWAVAFAATLAISAALFPFILRVPYRGWMKLGLVLGWVNSRVVLLLVYYLLFVPIGALLRLFGKDPIKRRFEPGLDSYRNTREPRDAEHLKHQF